MRGKCSPAEAEDGNLGGGGGAKMLGFCDLAPSRLFRILISVRADAASRFTRWDQAWAQPVSVRGKRSTTLMPAMPTSRHTTMQALSSYPVHRCHPSECLSRESSTNRA